MKVPPLFLSSVCPAEKLEGKCYDTRSLLKKMIMGMQEMTSAPGSAV